MRFTLAVLIVAVLLAACAQPVDLDLPITERPTSIDTPATETPTPVPVPKTLIVCLGQEPQSLYRYSDSYLYGAASRAAESVLHAIYDGPLNVRTYAFEPVILEKLPSFEDGDARIEQIAISEGESYFDPVALQPATLEASDRYLPSGCNSPDCIRTYSGGEVSMDRIVADFRMRSDVTWSDGEPVTAEDSVFSFEIDRHIDTPTLKTQVDRTAAYEALNESTVRWTGIPGYIDSEYASNFWSPLPQHQLGDLSPEDLLTADDTNRAPLGWGPYVFQEWRPGVDIRLTRNPVYFRASEGLPQFETLLFRFIGGTPTVSIEQLLTSECDILDESAIADALDVEVLDADSLSTLTRLAASGTIQLASTAGAEMERLDFGLTQSSLLADVQFRSAVASCIDRGRIARELLYGLTAVPETYLPPSHPLYAQDIVEIDYDPEMAAEVLEQLGWIDHDGDPATARVAAGAAGVGDGTELVLQYLTTPDGLHQTVAEWLQSDLQGCGIALEPEFRNQIELFEAFPSGPAFGQDFETIGWAWPAWVSPLCEMFHSAEQPSADTPLGVNAAGYADPNYDAACGLMLHALPESAEYLQAARDTQIILAEAQPMIPLYMRPRLIAHRPEICGIQVDPTEYSALWNLEELRFCTNPQ